MERRSRCRPRWWATMTIVVVCCIGLASAETSTDRSTATTFGLRIRPPLSTRHKPHENGGGGRTGKPGNDDGLLLADAGGGGNGGSEGQLDDKKSLAQQVAEGKYGLIQDLLPKKVKRPGIVSYASNPEVPADTADNLGGLDQEDIWLAEDHVLVLSGGGFRDKGGGGGLVPQWPAIDDFQAPRRQVKIPARPSVPPPFPVQLRDGESPKFIGGHPGNYPPGSGPGPWAPAVNGSLPVGPPAPPYPLPPLPPPPDTRGNLTDPFDEDDPSLYYPPPYDFYYPSDNTTQIPPGPLVPGIVLPPPPDFFSPLNDTSNGKTNGKHHTTSTPGPKYLPPSSVKSTPKVTRPKTGPIAQEIPSVRGGKTTANTKNKERNNVRVRYPGQTDTPLYYYDGPGISQQVVVTSSSPKQVYIDDLYERQKPSGFQKEAKPPNGKNHVIYIFTSPDDDYQGNQVSTEAPVVVPAVRDVPTPPRIEDFHDTSHHHQLVSGGGGYLHHTGIRGYATSGVTATPQVTSRPTNNYFVEDYIANSYSGHASSGKQVPQNNQHNPYIYFSFPASDSQRGNGTRNFQQTSAPPTRHFPNHQSNEGRRPYVQQTGIYDLHTVTYRPQAYYNEDYLNNRDPVPTATPKPPSRPRGHSKQLQQSHGVSVITVKPAVLYAGSANKQQEDDSITPVIPRPDTSYSQIDDLHKNPGISIVTSKPYVYSIGSALSNLEANRNHQAVSFDSGYASSQRPDTASIGGNPVGTAFLSGGSRIRFPQDSSLHQRDPGYVLVNPSPAPIPRRPNVPSTAVQYQEYFEAKGQNPESHLTQLRGFGTYDGLLTQAKPLHVQVHGDSGRIPQRESFHEDGAGHYVLSTPAPPVKQQYNQNPPYLSNSYRNVDLTSVRSTPPPSYDRRPLHQSSQGSNYEQVQQVFAHKAPVQLRYSSPTSAPFIQSSSTTASPLPAYFTTHDVSLFDDATKNYFNVFGQKLNEGAHIVQPTTPLPYDDRSGLAALAYHGHVETSTPVVSLQDDIRVNFRDPLPPINPDSEFVVPHQGSSRPAPSKHHGGAVVSYQLPGVDGKGTNGASHYYFLTPQPVSSNARIPQQGSFYSQQGGRPSSGDYWAGYTSG